jgi:hypothetical protein
MSYRRRRINSGGSQGFDPTTVSAVSAWLRLAGGTITGSGYSSVPDMLSVNPATQSSDAIRPVNGTSANGLPIVTCDGTTALSWPLNAGNNGTTQWGFAAWVKTTTAAGVRELFNIDSVGSGASSRKLQQVSSGTSDMIDVFDVPGTSARRASMTSLFTLNTLVFVTFELDLNSGAAEASRCVITRNAAVQTLSFSDANGTPGSVPVAMGAPTGNAAIYSRFVNGASTSWIGDVGPNIFILGSKMPGATEGLLTTAARTALMNFEAPT